MAVGGRRVAPVAGNTGIWQRPLFTVVGDLHYEGTVPRPDLVPALHGKDASLRVVRSVVADEGTRQVVALGAPGHDVDVFDGAIGLEDGVYDVACNVSRQVADVELALRISAFAGGLPSAPGAGVGVSTGPFPGVAVVATLLSTVVTAVLSTVVATVSAAVVATVIVAAVAVVAAATGVTAAPLVVVRAGPGAALLVVVVAAPASALITVAATVRGVGAATTTVCAIRVAATTTIVAAVAVAVPSAV
mmetsp:Transcript_113777/g.321772  ORF Transcript_113777/g.321772 Transcript_113777/m.321772 type:complete len:247 (-) Transcript_113777:443-1183(-)